MAATNALACRVITPPSLSRRQSGNLSLEHALAARGSSKAYAIFDGVDDQGAGAFHDRQRSAKLASSAPATAGGGDKSRLALAASVAAQSRPTTARAGHGENGKRKRIERLEERKRSKKASDAEARAEAAIAKKSTGPEAIPFGEQAQAPPSVTLKRKGGGGGDKEAAGTRLSRIFEQQVARLAEAEKEREGVIARYRALKGRPMTNGRTPLPPPTS